MRLPNGGRAIIDPRKLVDYALNPANPDGKPRLWAERVGITRENWLDLRDTLLAVAANGEVDEVQESAFGTKYVIFFEMQGQLGTAWVRSVWMIDSGQDIPRLITTFPAPHCERGRHG